MEPTDSIDPRRVELEYRNQAYCVFALLALVAFNIIGFQLLVIYRGLPEVETSVSRDWGPWPSFGFCFWSPVKFGHISFRTGHLVTPAGREPSPHDFDVYATDSQSIVQSFSLKQCLIIQAKDIQIARDRKASSTWLRAQFTFEFDTKAKDPTVSSGRGWLTPGQKIQNVLVRAYDDHMRKSGDLAMPLPGPTHQDVGVAWVQLKKERTIDDGIASERFVAVSDTMYVDQSHYKHPFSLNDGVAHRIPLRGNCSATALPSKHSSLSTIGVSIELPSVPGEAPVVLQQSVKSKKMRYLSVVVGLGGLFTLALSLWNVLFVPKYPRSELAATVGLRTWVLAQDAKATDVSVDPVAESYMTFNRSEP